MKPQITKLILTLFLIVGLCASSFSQDFKKGYARIHFKSKSDMEFLGKNMSLDNDTFQFQRINKSGNKDINYSFDLSEVEEIEIGSPRGVPGFMIGTGVGVVTMIIMDNAKKKDQKPYVLEKGLSKGKKLGIASAGSFLGFAIGYSIKKWTTIYESDLSMNNSRNLNFALDIDRTLTPMLFLGINLN